MAPRLRNPLVIIYRQVALDYFHRLGGAGRYQGFEEWHPALLVLGCTLEASGEYSLDRLGEIWSRLPYEIVVRCDGLREKVTNAFIQELKPVEARLECARLGADLLLQELSAHRRGMPLSHEQSRFFERVKLEFDLALRDV